MGFRSLCARTLGACGRNLPTTNRSIALLVALGALSAGNSVLAQNNGGFFNNRVVGGVRIDADGVMRTATEEDKSESLTAIRESLIGPQGQLQQPTSSRLISLKNVQKVVLESLESNKPIPEEILYLGGLTRVENIYVFPERQDIVLAGPAEPWKVGPAGSIVGTKSGKPVVYLDDLLNALKTVQEARRSGISVSIEPTPEGIVNLNKLLGPLQGNSNQPNWQSLESAMRNAFGPQQVKLSGVDRETHMARVILAADYKMKLYGMNLEPAPVAGLPSYLDMVKQSTSRNLQSRFWMACDYNAIEHSQDRLAWKISGRGIKTLTEEENIANDGSVKQSGKVDAIAKKWADRFTSKLDELSSKEPVFGELRNVMDLCVVAAIIESQHLQDLGHCDLTALVGDTAKIQLTHVDFPSSLDPQCSFVNTAQGFLVSASGGVMVDSWQVASKVKASDSVTRTENGLTWNVENRVWQ